MGGIGIRAIDWDTLRYAVMFIFLVLCDTEGVNRFSPMCMCMSELERMRTGVNLLGAFEYEFLP